VVSGIGFLVGAFATTRFSDRVERKHSTALFAVAWAISLFVIGYFVSPAVIIVFGANSAWNFSSAFLVMGITGLITGALILLGIKATGRSLESATVADP
jgi:MFS family permease